MIGVSIDHTIRTAIGVFGDQGRINGAAATILTVSFLVSVIGEWRKELRGERADWSTPITRLITFGLLLAFYALVARELVALVASLGDLQAMDPASAKQTVFAARAEAFSKTMGDDASFSFSNLELGAAAFVNSLLDVVTYMTFTLAAACVFILKVIQKVMLNVLLTLGPLMIAFGSIPGLTSQFLSAWVLGVIEVTAWGVTAKIFLAMLIASERSTTVNPDVTQNLAEHIVFNVVYGTSFLIIPVATAAILRGGSASIGQTAVSAAQAAAIGAGAALAGGASLVAHKGSQALGLVPRGGSSGGGSRGASAPRAGDAGVSPPETAAPKHNIRVGDAGQQRRAAFARNGAIRRHERGRD